MTDCGDIYLLVTVSRFFFKYCAVQNIYKKNKSNQLLVVFVAMGGIPEITRDASVGNVALVIVSATIVLLMLIITAALFIKRKDWHLDGKSSLHLKDK